MHNPDPIPDKVLSRKPNLKSDVDAKVAFIQTLKSRGFESARVTQSPADITASKDGQTYFYEIKYTARNKSYFGAATLTEWEAALQHEQHYRFVVATKRNDAWVFHEYTPAEFMDFSTIPPFKAYFNVDVDLERDTRARGTTKSVKLTRERLAQMVALFKSFRSER